MLRSATFVGWSFAYSIRESEVSSSYLLLGPYLNFLRCPKCLLLTVYENRIQRKLHPFCVFISFTSLTCGGCFSLHCFFMLFTGEGGRFFWKMFHVPDFIIASLWCHLMYSSYVPSILNCKAWARFQCNAWGMPSLL